MRMFAKAVVAAAVVFAAGSISQGPAEAFYSGKHCKHYRAIKMKQAKDPFHWILAATEASTKRVWHGAQCKWW